MPSFKKDDLVPLYALLRGWPGGPNVRVKWRHSESGKLAPLAAVKPSVPTTWQGTWLGMQPAQVLLPLLGVLFLHHQQHVQGAALDLAALVRQYEDQVGSVGLDRFTGIWPCCESSLREFISGVRKASCSWRGWRGTWGSRGCRLVVHLLKREVSQYSLYRTTCRGSWLGLWPKTWSGTSCFWKIWTVLIWLYTMSPGVGSWCGPEWRPCDFPPWPCCLEREVVRLKESTRCTKRETYSGGGLFWLFWF